MLNDVPGYGPEDTAETVQTPAPETTVEETPTQAEENAVIGIDTAEGNDETNVAEVDVETGEYTLLNDVTVLGEDHVAGDVITVAKSIGDKLVEDGDAE